MKCRVIHPARRNKGSDCVKAEINIDGLSIDIWDFDREQPASIEKVNRMANDIITVFSAIPSSDER